MNILSTLKNKTRSFHRKTKNAIAYSTLALAAAITCAPGMAKATDIDDLFLAVDISGLSTNVKTMYLAFAGLLLLAIGWKFLRRTGGRA